MTKKIKKTIAAGVIATGLLSVSAVTVSCGTVDNDKKVAILLSTLNNPFFSTIRNDINARIAERKLIGQVFDANNSTETEATHVDNIIAQGFKVVIFNDVNETSGFSAIKKFNDAGVEVINIDHPIFPKNPGPTIQNPELVKDYKVAANIASDNQQAGRVLAKYLNGKLKLPTSLKTFTLYGIPGTESSERRGTGFQSQIGSTGTDKFTLSSLPSPNNTGNAFGVQADDNRDKANTATANAIGNHFTNENTFKNIVFATNDESGQGAIAALKSKNIEFAGNKEYDAATDTKKTWIVSVDHSNDALKSLKDGSLTSTVKQSISGMSNLSVDIAESILDGTFKIKKVSDWESIINADNSISSVEAANASDASKTLNELTGGHFFKMSTLATTYNKETNKYQYWAEKDSGTNNEVVEATTEQQPII